MYLIFPYAISEMRRRGGIDITAHLGAELLLLTEAAQTRVDKISLAALLNLLEPGDVAVAVAFSSWVDDTSTP